jgi:hypothetical protein
MPVSSKLFRGLMIGSLALTVLAFITDLVFPRLIPEGVRFAEEVYWNEMPSGVFTFRLIVFVAYVVASLIAFVGLYQFKRWARTANLVLTGLIILFAPAMGHILLSGVAQGLADVALLLWGAVLALAYFSSISQRFAPK